MEKYYLYRSINGKFESAVTVQRWQGDFSAKTPESVIPAIIIAKIYNNGTKADFTISCKFETFINSGSDYNIFNVQALKDVCNCNNISCNAKNTNVILYRTDGQIAADDYYFGRTGLLLHIDNTSSYFERIYGADMIAGGWARSEAIYKAGNYAIINVDGADIS